MTADGGVSSYRCGRCSTTVPAGVTRCPVCDAALASEGEKTNGVPIGRRALSWLVDSMLIGLLLVLVFSVLGAAFPERDQESSDGGALGALSAVAALMVPALYAAPFDARSGQTPGRRVAGTRVAALDGRDRLGARAALIRAISRYVSLLPLGLGFAWAATGARKTWHDLISRSVVVGTDTAVVVEDHSRPSSLAQRQVVDASTTLLPPHPVASGVVQSDDSSPPVSLAPSIHLDPEVGLSLADALGSRAHFEEAASLLAAALRSGERSDSRDWCRVALLLVDAGRSTDALVVTNEVLLSEPTLGLALSVQAHALLGLGAGSTTAALEVAERALRYDGAEPLAVTATAAALVANRRLEDAEALLDERGELGSEAHRGARSRLSIAELRGDESAALRWAEVAADAEPFDARSQARVATAGWLSPPYGAPFADRLRDDARRLRRVAIPIAPGLAARCQRLERAFEMEPQCEPALRAILDLRPAARGRLTVNILVSILVGFMIAGSALRLLPLAGGIPVAVLVVLAFGLRIPPIVTCRRELGPLIPQWRRYAEALERARLAGQRPRARATSRPPIPPANTVLESAARCHCDSLNFLYGGLAVEYARQHLTARGSYSPDLTELICPSTLARWLAIEGRHSQTGMAAPPRLCRLGDVWPGDSQVAGLSATPS